MLSASIVKEALIAGVTAGIVIPVLWMLGAAVNPERDIHSPGLDLVVLTLAGAAMVLLLRSTCRTSAGPSDRDNVPEDWANDSYDCGYC